MKCCNLHQTHTDHASCILGLRLFAIYIYFCTSFHGFVATSRKPCDEQKKIAIFLPWSFIVFIEVLHAFCNDFSFVVYDIRLYLLLNASFKAAGPQSGVLLLFALAGTRRVNRRSRGVSLASLRVTVDNKWPRPSEPSRNVFVLPCCAVFFATAVRPSWICVKINQFWKRRAWEKFSPMEIHQERKKFVNKAGRRSFSFD